MMAKVVLDIANELNSRGERCEKTVKRDYMINKPWSTSTYSHQSVSVDAWRETREVEVKGSPVSQSSTHG